VLSRVKPNLENTNNKNPTTQMRGAIKPSWELVKQKRIPTHQPTTTTSKTLF